MGQMVNRLSTMWEIRVQSLGWEDPLEKEMAIHSSTIAWSGLPCPPPGDLPNPGIEPGSPALQADSLQSEPSGSGCVF